MPSLMRAEHDTCGNEKSAGVVLCLVLLLLPFLSACSPLGHRMEEIVATAHLQESRLRGNQFELLALERKTAQGDLHVYIEGDGRPWTGGGTRISSDPTPRQPNALHLMASDPKGALYLGRPCYFGSAGTPPCEPRLWTFERFGETVVSAMSDALNTWAGQHPGQKITLIGYSGGGVLALLIAERLPSVQRVVAVSAPIDHRRWTELHDYTPLYGSINPGEMKRWRTDVERVFIFGGKDANVPAAIFSPLAARLINASVVILPEQDHDCCEENAWLQILQSGIGD